MSGLQPLSKHISLSVVIVTAALFSARNAAGKADDVKITWSVLSTELKGAPGATINVQLKAEMPKGWHTYSAKKIDGPYTAITATPETLVSVNGDITATGVRVVKPGTDENPFDVPIELIEGSGTYTVPVKLAADAKAGAQQVKFSIKTQVCSAGADGKCVPVKNDVPFVITVSEGGKPKGDEKK